MGLGDGWGKADGLSEVGAGGIKLSRLLRGQTGAKSSFGALKAIAGRGLLRLAGRDRRHREKRGDESGPEA